MSRKKTCEVCGGEIWGRAQRVLIEGVELLACSGCAAYGERVRFHLKPGSGPRGGGPTSGRRGESGRSPLGGPTRPHREKPELEVMPGYGALLRRIRATKKMTQLQLADALHEKVSLIKKLELERVKPTIKLAQKIERTFQVKILKESDDEPIVTLHEKPKSVGPATLGDMVVRKKRKKPKSDQ
ncbi:MAG: multiprotein bridging factor aMBF1 [Promethearchaeota archaeon]